MAPTAERLLDPQTPLFAMSAGRGHTLAFPTEAEAAECVAAIPGASIRRLRFGALLDANPKALVHVHEQYYWASDLA